MLRIGLTGNIASGKSIVESYFEKKGIYFLTEMKKICYDIVGKTAERLRRKA